MRIPPRPVLRGLTLLIAVVALSSCRADDGSADQTRRPSPTTTAPAATPAAPPASSPALAEPRTEKWVDLDVGDCLADLPPSDPSVVTVTVVDCAAPHRAEVYLRAPVGVNAAIADVANDKCAVGLSQYTRQSVAESPWAMTYLIDSDQDRTSSNPDPSTVICVLHSADDEPVTGSAHRR